jgi:hypothetical protein
VLVGSKTELDEEIELVGLKTQTATAESTHIDFNSHGMKNEGQPKGCTKSLTQCCASGRCVCSLRSNLGWYQDILIRVLPSIKWLARGIEGPGLVLPERVIDLGARPVGVVSTDGADDVGHDDHDEMEGNYARCLQQSQPRL